MDINVVKMDGMSHILTVKPQDTLGSLKTLIEGKFGVPPHKQKLAFVNGQKIPLNDDSKPVSSYGLQSGSQVSLLVIEAPTQVVITNLNGGKNAYDIKPDETVMNLKKRVEHREGVQVSQQRLVYESKELIDSQTLSHYNIRAGGNIHMTSCLRGGC